MATGQVLLACAGPVEVHGAGGVGVEEADKLLGEQTQRGLVAGLLQGGPAITNMIHTDQHILV